MGWWRWFHPRRPPRGGILLVTAPPWSIHNPPLGLACLAAYLRRHGVEVEAFDFNISLYRRIEPRRHRLWLPTSKARWSRPEDFATLLEAFTDEIDGAVAAILERRRPVVGFSVVDPKERITIEVIRRLLREDASLRIVLGGPAVSTPEQRGIFLQELAGKVDAMVVGEGEEALLGIMREWEVGGCRSAAGSRPAAPLLVTSPPIDLATLPFPTYEEFDLSQYEGGGLFVEWSRGCIGSCHYCKGRTVLGPYRVKPAALVVEELAWHHARGAASHFIVCDNLLNGNVRVLEEVCDRITGLGLPVTWEGQAVPHVRMTPALLARMRAAGCLKLQWGIESGSDRVLLAAGKGRLFTVREAERVLASSREAGIENEVFLMVGLPGEGEEELAETLGFLRRAAKDIARVKSVNTLHLVHGTDLRDAPERYGLTFPPGEWHYLWEADGGSNTYQVRVERARRVMAEAASLGLPVQEDNLFEGAPPSPGAPFPGTEADP